MLDAENAAKISEINEKIIDKLEKMVYSIPEYDCDTRKNKEQCEAVLSLAQALDILNDCTAGIYL